MLQRKRLPVIILIVLIVITFGLFQWFEKECREVYLS